MWIYDNFNLCYIIYLICHVKFPISYMLILNLKAAGPIKKKKYTMIFFSYISIYSFVDLNFNTIVYIKSHLTV